jgi:citrate synthase
MKGIDPRYECLRKFCKQKLPEDPYFRLLSKLGGIVPRAMMAQGKVRNPWPNVDAIIGVVFNHFGLRDERFFPVVLGVARSIGALSQLVWDRALCLPLERPSSVTLDWIERYCEEEEEEKERKKMSLIQETS